MIRVEGVDRQRAGPVAWDLLSIPRPRLRRSDDGSETDLTSLPRSEEDLRCAADD
jgi:hypothetical protein